MEIKTMIRLLKIRLLVLALTLAALTAGCSGCSIFQSSPDKSAAAVAYSDQSLYNYKQGQYYASAGRFEIAKEYYLLALAATTDPEMQDAISRELEAADAAILIQR